MSHERVDQHFKAIAFKRLSNVDTLHGTSTQNEVGGRKEFERILGIGREYRRKERSGLPSRFVHLSDDENESVTLDDSVSWYDTRKKQPHRKPEWRLYYPKNEITNLWKEGDLFIFAQHNDGTLYLITAPAGSTIERQLQWLFGVEADDRTQALFATELEGAKHDFQARDLLERIGLVIDPAKTGYLDRMIDQFGNSFPTTARFSKFARDTSGIQDAKADPDLALLTWYEHEDRLFREFEAYIIGAALEKIKDGPDGLNVEEFMRFSLSAHQRRKSRAGYAFGHHVAAVLQSSGVPFEREARTEQGKRLDFVIPATSAYHDPLHPIDRLIALAAKTTCKDRWRQVLSEANRISKKHLITLESEISDMQLREMSAGGVQLVVPAQRHWDVSPGVSSQIMSVQQFIEMALNTIP